jgi:hypothetical protein
MAARPCLRVRQLTAHRSARLAQRLGLREPDAVQQHERPARLDVPEGLDDETCLHAGAARVHVPRRAVDPHLP